MHASGHAQLEKRLFALFKESGELEFPEEEWVFEVLPELNSLESDTLDQLLVQAQQHAKYEQAARELVLSERRRLEAEHEQEMRSLRAELDSENTRSTVNADMRLKRFEERASEENDALRQEANEKVPALNE